MNDDHDHEHEHDLKAESVSWNEFKRSMQSLEETICKEVFEVNQDSIRIKKEKTAVKNFKKIFDAVFQITYEKGFQAMSMRDLSAKTGMSMGSLYGYFKGKEELLAIIQRQGRTIIERVLESSFNRSDDPVIRLKNVIKAHLFLSEKARPWFYFTFMEARNLTNGALESVIRLEEYTEDILVSVLEQGERQGVFTSRNHRLTASIIKAMQQDWYLKRWKYGKRNISVEDYSDYVLEIVDNFCIQSK
ncbi:MAG: TetR/AcrR family transcriptional regulator [Desulfobacterium sp.]|jgi:AcrR family transcriptional regulator|nr:TetR/AcrR family transcriptional regulator [Desulfobacterium sp.]